MSGGLPARRSESRPPVESAGMPPSPAPPVRARAPFAARLRGWARRRFVEPERPLVAVEVRASSVGVVRVRAEPGRTALVSAAALDLAPGVVQPSLMQANVADPERLRAALRGALERAGVLAGAPIALVLPDPVARVSVLPAGELAGKRPAEVEELLRFRLKKALPFDVKEAHLGWAVSGSREGDSVVVAAVRRPVLESYEAVCRSLGLEPGLVELAGLALSRLAARAARDGDRLLVNWDEGYATFVVLREGWPLLVRSVAGVAAAPEELGREAASTLLYHRERMGGTTLAGAALRTAAVPPAQAAAVLQEALGIAPEVLDPLAALSSAATPAAAALAGAAASVGAP